MKCLCSGEQMRQPDNNTSKRTERNSKPLSSAEGEEARKPKDNVNIEEAELSLREASSLNYEEARALLGRIEYQKGNIEAALRVFEGIDINGISSQMKQALTQPEQHKRRHSHHSSLPPLPMSIHTVTLLFEAIFLKSKCLQRLHRFQEAAQTCRVVLDIVEGLSENVSGGSKLQETLIKAVELLPELWKLADSPREAILGYRRALLDHWRLDPEATTRIQKEFAVYLLYSGEEALPPNLRSQTEGSFIPRNNVEEAILLLIILLRKVNLRRIAWDSSILDHLSFALSIAGDLTSLAKQIEEMLPEILDRKDLHYSLSLCYYGAGQDSVALGLLKKLLSKHEDPNHMPGLLLASNICRESSGLAEEGIEYGRRALESGSGTMKSVASFVLGRALSESSRTSLTESERVIRQSEAVQMLKSSDKMDPDVVYCLALENAEQRKLDTALAYAKRGLKLRGGSDLRGWLLLIRILSAQKRFTDAETIVDAAIDETAKWEQGKLLRLKAKLRLAQRDVKGAIETYTQLLALLQVRRKSFISSTKKLLLHKGDTEQLEEVETWHDLAHVYISLSQWHDAEACLSKSRSIDPFSSAGLHAQGVMYARQGHHEEAMEAFTTALGIDPTHVPSLISTAESLLEQGNWTNAAVVRSFLMEALRIDRMSAAAWYNLGKLYKAEGSVSSSLEAAECFQAAATLQESAPLEPFR